MKRTAYQIVLFGFLALLCLSGILLTKHVLELPFRPTNDALHKRGSSLTLDFLIPGSTYLDDKITIGEVTRIRIRQESDPFQKALRTVSEMIPPGYRVIGNLLLFLFWTLCFLTLFRVFTFMRYWRALRSSLILGGITYFFMPDLSHGKGDDVLFVIVPLLSVPTGIVLTRRRRRKATKEEVLRKTGSQSTAA